MRQPCPYLTVFGSSYIIKGEGVHIEQRLKMFATIQTWEIFLVISDSGFQLRGRFTRVQTLPIIIERPCRNNEQQQCPHVHALSGTEYILQFVETNGYLLGILLRRA